MNGREKEVPGVRKQFCAPVCPPTHSEKGKQGDSGPHRPTDRPWRGEGNEEKEEARRREACSFYFTQGLTRRKGEKRSFHAACVRISPSIAEGGRGKEVFRYLYTKVRASAAAAAHGRTHHEWHSRSHFSDRKWPFAFRTITE